MPRFVARPVVVEAYHWDGNTVMLPDDFRRVIAVAPEGEALLQSPDGMRTCRRGDWLVRGAEGTFSVVRAAAFDAAYQESAPLPEFPVKRAYNRKEISHAE